MLVKFEDNTFAYYLAPQKIKIGDKVENGPKRDKSRKLYAITRYSRRYRYTQC